MLLLRMQRTGRVMFKMILRMLERRRFVLKMMLVMLREGLCWSFRPDVSHSSPYWIRSAPSLALTTYKLAPLQIDFQKNMPLLAGSCQDCDNRAWKRGAKISMRKKSARKNTSKHLKEHKTPKRNIKYRFTNAYSTGWGENNTSMCSYIALVAFCTSADKKTWTTNNNNISTRKCLQHLPQVGRFQLKTHPQRILKVYTWFQFKGLFATQIWLRLSHKKESL